MSCDKVQCYWNVNGVCVCMTSDGDIVPSYCPLRANH